MKRVMPIAGALLVATGLVAWAVNALTPSGDPVVTARLPDGARLPQVSIDHDGRLHLVYFEGVMSGGDLVYVSRGLDEHAWSASRIVNSEPRSAVGVGPIDGGQIAADPRNGRLHVVWFQTNPARFFYTRSTPDRSSFEPQRTLANLGDELVEAAPAVTIDPAGHVYVFWHATTEHGSDDAHRAVYMLRSTNGGETFDSPRPISPLSEGACGCCNLRALADEDHIVVSYRGAGDNIQRGQRLLTSTDGGDTWSDVEIEPWALGACPVSTTSLVPAPTSPRVAWETQGQVRFAAIDRLDRPVTPEGAARHRRKNPVLAVNARGETLLAWGDGPGFRAGGTLHWQIFDTDGRPIGGPGPGTDSIPSGSTAAVVTRPDGGFVVLY